MNDKKIIEIINTISNQKFNTADSQEINIEETILALVNGFYYVKSGEDTERFHDAIDCIIAATHEEGCHPYRKNMKKYLIKDDIQTAVAFKARELILNSFDKDFFHLQVEKTRYNNETRTNLLKQYLNKYTKSQLYEFIAFFMGLNSEIPEYLFDFDTFCEMTAMFNCLACEVDPSIPRAGSDEFKLLVKKNPFYYAECLSKEVLIDVLVFYASKQNTELVLYMAKALSVLKLEEAWFYTKMVIYFTEEFGINLFEERHVATPFACDSSQVLLVG